MDAKGIWLGGRRQIPFCTERLVKLHAMIETGLNGAIIRELNRPGEAFDDVIAKLDTSSATGKVAFAKALGIIPKDAGVFIQHLSQLRNKCVHNIKNFNFDLRRVCELKRAWKRW